MKNPRNQPNIIFFFSDQQRWDTVGAYGQTLDVTQHLDKMATEGTRFEYAFTCQPVCGPARACLQTGKYATETGCFRNGIALPPDEFTLAREMSRAGYEVGYIGKWHLASTHGMGENDIDYRTTAVPPERRGGYKDYWLAADVLEFTSHSYDGHMFDGAGKPRKINGYRADGQTDFVLEYLRNRSGEQPFFLFISYIEPHHQNDHSCYEGPKGSRERFADFVPPLDLVNRSGDWQASYPDYLGCCASLDHNLGRIREELDALSISGNTLIIYTSDHGSHFRTRNAEYKRACHDACIRIPLVIHGPGFRGGNVVKELVSLIDLPPTILAAAEHDIPNAMQGRPLQQLIDGTPADWPNNVFLQISESQVGRAIRTKRWKYSIVAPGCGGSSQPGAEEYIEEFLYDLKKDPHEGTNLVAMPDYEAIRSELRQLLILRMVEAGEDPPLILKSEH